MPPAVLAIFMMFVAVFTMLSIHKVDEGHVGIYFRGGALMDMYTEPGYHLKMPYVTTMDQVQITVQT